MKKFAQEIKKMPIWVVLCSLFVSSVMFIFLSKPVLDGFYQMAQLKDDNLLLTWQFWVSIVVLAAFGFLLCGLSVIVRLLDKRFMQYLDD